MERATDGEVDWLVNAAGEQLCWHQARESRRADASTARCILQELGKEASKELSANRKLPSGSAEAARLLGLVGCEWAQLPRACHGPVRVWKLLCGLCHAHADCPTQDQPKRHQCAALASWQGYAGVTWTVFDIDIQQWKLGSGFVLLYSRLSSRPPHPSIADCRNFNEVNFVSAAVL